MDSDFDSLDSGRSDSSSRSENSSRSDNTRSESSPSNSNRSEIRSVYRSSSFEEYEDYFVHDEYLQYSSRLRKDRHLLPFHKAHLVPVEIYSEIFLHTIQGDPRSQTNLMLVCRRWHEMMLSTSGIHSRLRIDRWTKKKVVERFGRRWFLDVTFDTGDQWYLFGLRPLDFYACFMAAAEAASRWRSLVLLSLPPSGEYRDLQIMHPFQHLESFKLAASCNLGNFLEPLITAITTTVTPRFTVMEVFHPDAALYLVQPSHFRIFSSLTTLRLICKGMQNPVDVLPSLHKLEIFEAHYLSLPSYPPAVDLPLTQILRVLHLRSVSVQWIAGRIFPALEECSIIFPHHADAIQSVYLPSCSNLKYDSNNLRTLEHFHHPPLARLEIKCGQWMSWRGNLQLAALHHTFAAQSLTCLHLEIKCSERLLGYMLRLVPALEELWMGLSSPGALSSDFFMAFATGGRNAIAGPSSQTITPLCRQLKELHLHYNRWSRVTERNALIPAFGAIVAAHPRGEQQNLSFRLSFGEGPKLQEWIIHDPMKEFGAELNSDRAFIGVSGAHGIVPLSRASVGNGDDPLTELEYLPLPMESEYITTHEPLALPIDYFLSFRSLKEVRMYGLDLEIESNAQFSSIASLFHTLKVLAVSSAPPSLFAGQIFPKLERYQERWSYCSDNPDRDLLIEMPVCTRLVVPLSRLVTVMLPQICELGVFIDHEKPNYIWGKHIATNANISGLKLLHLCVDDDDPRNDDPRTAILDIIGSLPALETLVLDGRHLAVPYIDFFKAFIPMNEQGTSGRVQSNSESQIPGVLCPGLKSVQIEGIRLTEQPKLMPILKDIVTLRFISGSPLKSFTFYFPGHPGKKWEVIGRDRSFCMQEISPARRFRLDI